MLSGQGGRSSGGFDFGGDQVAAGPFDLGGVQARTGFAIRNVVRQLRPLRSATIAINGAVQTFPPEIPDDKKAILDSLN